MRHVRCLMDAFLFRSQTQSYCQFHFRPCSCVSTPTRSRNQVLCQYQFPVDAYPSPSPKINPFSSAGFHPMKVTGKNPCSFFLIPGSWRRPRGAFFRRRSALDEPAQSANRTRFSVCSACPLNFRLERRAPELALACSSSASSRLTFLE